MHAPFPESPSKDHEGDERKAAGKTIYSVYQVYTVYYQHDKENS